MLQSNLKITDDFIHIMKILTLKKIEQLNLTASTPVISCFSYSQDYVWLDDELRSLGISHEFYRLTNSKGKRGIWGGIVNAWRAVRKAKKLNALLVSHNPYATFLCSQMMRLSFSRIPHLAWTWHFPYFPSKKQIFLEWLNTNYIDAYVVHSLIEVTHASERFHVSSEKIYTAYWSYEEIPIDALKEPLVKGDYVCTIGGSDRDYITTLKAMAALPDIKMVLVCRPENIEGLSIPNNVTVLTQIPLIECWRLINHCRLFLLPLNSSESHCGHSVLVTAMMLGKPCIVTHSECMVGYVHDQKTAHMVPAESPDAIVLAVKSLWENRAISESVASSGKYFAESNFGKIVVAQTFINATGLSFKSSDSLN